MKPLTRVGLKGLAKLAKTLSLKLRGGEIFGLVGPLGSGKTAFAQALGKHLNVKHKITSPTFTLLHSFPARLKNKKGVLLYHLDLYRTKNFKEIRALGLTEFWGKPQSVTLIEWADKIFKHLPKKTKIIVFKHHE